MLGFAIVGCGMIAEFHTLAINEMPNARVVAAWSRNAASGAKIERLADGGCRIFDELEPMLIADDEDDVDEPVESLDPLP